MGGRLWGSLAIICICFLVIMRDDADQQTPWDKGQPDKQSSSSAKMWRWTPPAPEVKPNNRDEGPPAATSRRNPLVLAEKGHTRMRRAAVFPKDNGALEEELGTIYQPVFTKARDKETLGTRRSSEHMDILQERHMSWSLKSWTPGNMDSWAKTDVSEDTSTIKDTWENMNMLNFDTMGTLGNMEESGDTSATKEPATTVTIPSSIVPTWTSGNMEESGDTSATNEPTTTVTIPSSIVTTWTTGNTEESGDMSATTEPSTTVSTLSSTATADITSPTSPSSSRTTISGTTAPVTTPTTVSATMTTPTTTTTTTATTSPGQCQNGATWDGTKCRCPDGYYGVHCEIAICQNGGTWANGLCQCTEDFHGFECQFVKETIEVKNVTVNATVEMTTKVDNKNFTEELKNKNSAAFKDFEKEFKEQMREIYKNIEGYQDVVIHELTQGSIVVNYTVLLKVLASTTANETVESISKNLVSAFNNYTSCNESCQGSNCSFCFNTTFTNITNFGVQEVETSLCDSLIPEGFTSYYFPLVTNTGVLCITRCDKRSADPYPCVHGRCNVARTGPQCECSDQLAFWYQDSACSSRVSKVGVAVGVPVAALVMAIAIFTVLLVRARRQKGEDRDKLTSSLELYHSADESWTSSQGFAASNQAATWEALQTSSTVNINLERVDTSQKIHIQRPSHIVIP